MFLQATNSTHHHVIGLYFASPRFLFPTRRESPRDLCWQTLDTLLPMFAVNTIVFGFGTAEDMHRSGQDVVESRLAKTLARFKCKYTVWHHNTDVVGSWRPSAFFLPANPDLAKGQYSCPPRFALSFELTILQIRSRGCSGRFESTFAQAHAHIPAVDLAHRHRHPIPPFALVPVILQLCARPGTEASRGHPTFHSAGVPQLYAP